MFKKGMCLLLSLLMIAAVIPAAAADGASSEPLAVESKFTDAISLPSGDISIDGNNGWSISGSEMTALQTADPQNAQNKVVKMERKTFDGTASVTKSFDAQSGKKKVSVRLNAKDAQNSKLQISLCGATLTFGLENGIAAITSGTEVMQGAYDGYNRTGYLGAYSKTGWFELGVIADTTEGSIEVFIDNNKVNATKLAATEALSNVSFSIAESAGIWYADDFKLSSYNDGSVDDSVNSAAWQTICAENFKNIKYNSNGSLVDVVERVLVPSWRKNGIQFWTGKDGNRSQPTNAGVRSQYKLINGNGWLELERQSGKTSSETDWPYYNFLTSWNSLRELGGKSLVSFRIYSPKHSSSDTRSRYFGLVDKSGNQVIKMSVLKNNLVINGIKGTWFGTITSGNTVITLLTDWDNKTISVYSNGTLLNDLSNISFGDKITSATCAPARLFFGLDNSVTVYDDHTYVKDIKISQWNEYAVSSLWTESISDDLEWNTILDSAINGAQDWTSNDSAVWAQENGDGMIKLNSGAEAVKSLGSAELNGLAAVSAEIKASEGSAQSISLLNGSDKIAEVLVNNGKITANGEELSGITADEWFKLTIALNTKTGKYWVYKNNQQLNTTGFVGTAKAVNALSFACTDGTGYINNLSAGTMEDAVYTVRDVIMQKADGEFAGAVESGVTVKTLKIAKGSDAEGAKAIVAIYDNDRLAATKAVDLSAGYDVGSLITLPVDIAAPSDEGTYSAKVFIWSDMENARPVAKAYEITPRKTTLLIAGDSIAQTYTWYWHYPMTGYGQTIGSYLDTDKVNVNNFGLSGSSTVTYETSGQLEKLLNAGHSGDYMTIQFAHNDQGQGVSIDDYKANLKKYIALAREKGINPILITSPIRRPNAGMATLGEYPNAMKAVASETGTPVIDLNSRSTEIMTAAGDEGTKLIYMHINANDERYFKTADGKDNYSNSQYNKSTPTADNTHFTVYGAHLLSQAIVSELASLENCGLSAYAMPDKTDPEIFKAK